MPRTYQDHDGQPEPNTAKAFVVEIEGEEFAVRLVTDLVSGYTDADYTWLSGPNKGYGFGVGGPPNPSPEEHRQRIRDFLAMVDPTTGYIEGD